MVAYDAINLLTFLIGFGLLYNSYSLINQDREDIVLVGLSFVLGAGLIFVAVFPGGFDPLGNLIGIEFKARAILVVSNLTLFIIVLYLLNRVGELQANISKLNEEQSLLKNSIDEED